MLSKWCFNWGQFSIFYFRKSSLSLIKKMIYYIPSPLLEDICNQSGASTGVSFLYFISESPAYH